MLKNMGLREDAGLKRGEVIREDHIKGASSSIPITKYYSADQIKMHEMDGACSTYGRQDRCIQDCREKT